MTAREKILSNNGGIHFLFFMANAMKNRGLKSAAIVFRPFGTIGEWLRLLFVDYAGWGENIVMIAEFIFCFSWLTP
jgi:hypothetical protein